MKIKKISIRNFRLLKDFSLDLENDLSLIIGKNNAGKTSILNALDKFLNASDKRHITIDDFNVDLKAELIALISGRKAILNTETYQPLGMSLKLCIEYEDEDDLSLVEPLLMSLDPKDKNIILSFEYHLSFDQLKKAVADYTEKKDKFDDKTELFLNEHHADYFGRIVRKSILSTDESVFTDLGKENISLDKVLTFEYISAKRDVTNQDNNRTLSSQTARIYQRTVETEEQEQAIDAFKKKLRDTDRQLSDIYNHKIFSNLLAKINKYGGIRKKDTQITIASTLQHRNLLDSNTTVLYKHQDHDLPEHYNGLGYMNLISMLFEIEILMGKFRRSSIEKPAPINLLFIEEPEAHTHPQMQYVFIKNIKQLLTESLLREDGLKIQLQTVISTHSSHIVAESDFDDIKYLKKDTAENCVKAKNLKSLKDEYASDKQAYKFLKQYLTLNRAELFFADKVILVEGDTERILLPAMMKKLDQESTQDDASVPLLSQNISIVEVGAHSQTFEKFIDFVGLKTLIITDIDSFYKHEITEDQKTKQKTKQCVPNNQLATSTSNSSLKFFHSKAETDLTYFISLTPEQKTLSKKSGSWRPDEDGRLMLVYQTEQDGYHGRSFEDAFFSLNKSLLGKDADSFPSLTKKWFDDYVANKLTALDFAEKAIGSKPSLAIEILLNSEHGEKQEFTNWSVPAYIKEGLEWLRKD
ncbi:MAG: ATP-dependent endonuclease [Gammaproteobacteria bacterium]|nr:ATP-dependent endonuclease [Gammaproteobacteria bacterium]MBU1554242.1 ATP-dependent endonuclease [Gammaproteobacteria bacterium]MBU2072703.1 ATP-dependent endonuclease [Gammaproteobacteria bacterium]MBU2182163.1 ATP-dependent endonuclease [Gammaproteobacteria bacterium]MBU2204777.1 ATP-dependent endonuclease [Gammaproteobacteria bacterium]